jgi:putative transposase
MVGKFKGEFCSPTPCSHNTATLQPCPSTAARDSDSTYFFTLVTENRAKILTSQAARDTLKLAFSLTQQKMPFEVKAIVLLEDHLHTIWTLPESDSDYSKRIGFLKKTFTQQYLLHGGLEQRIRDSKQRKRERGIWQRRFWEHTIRTDERMGQLLDYIHFNPVRHGLVRCPKEYPYSSFHRFVREGFYEMDWGCGGLEFEDLELALGEVD